ncbi:MAG TPA: tetratricopeptide repeat protein [bacterium]
MFLKSPIHIHKCHRCGRASLHGEKYCRKHIHLKSLDKIRRFSFTRSPEFLIGTALGLLGLAIGIYHLAKAPSEERIHQIIGQTIQTELESSGLAPAKTYEEVKTALGKDLPEIGQAVLDRIREATAYQESGRDSLAEEIYRTLIDLFPNIAELHFNLGLAYYDQDQLDEAGGEWRQTIEIDPAHQEAHLNLGIFLAGRKDYNAALRELRRAIQLKPDDPVPHYIMGMVFAERGQAREAIDQYKQFIVVAPAALEFEIETARQAIHDLGGQP